MPITLAPYTPLADSQSVKRCMICLMILCLGCIGANGSGRRMVTELQEHEYPYGISITHNSILWTDWKK